MWGRTERLFFGFLNSLSILLEITTGNGVFSFREIQKRNIFFSKISFRIVGKIYFCFMPNTPEA